MKTAQVSTGMQKPRQSLNDRFWSKVDIKDENDCWIWRATRSSEKRYGSFRFGHVMKQAHRVAWFICHGEMPDSNTVVCHRCDNPLCVNPSHLFTGTQADNIKDMDNKGRRGTWLHPGELNPMAKLTQLDVDSIIAAWENKGDSRTQKQIARDFGVSQSLVSCIVNKKRWKVIGKEKDARETCRIEGIKWI